MQSIPAIAIAAMALVLLHATITPRVRAKFESNCFQFVARLKGIAMLSNDSVNESGIAALRSRNDGP
jgi:hypothetical protein